MARGSMEDRQMVRGFFDLTDCLNIKMISNYPKRNVRVCL